MCRINYICQINHVCGFFIDQGGTYSCLPHLRKCWRRSRRKQIPGAAGSTYSSVSVFFKDILTHWSRKSTDVYNKINGGRIKFSCFVDVMLCVSYTRAFPTMTSQINILNALKKLLFHYLLLYSLCNVSLAKSLHQVDVTGNLWLLTYIKISCFSFVWKEVDDENFIFLFLAAT